MRNETGEAIRKDFGALTAYLKTLGIDVRGKSCRCPVHDDTHPSASIKQGNDGAWRLSCQVPTCGFHGDIFDLQARLSGRPLAEVLREAAPPSATTSGNRPDDTYSTLAALTSSFRNIEEINEYTHPDTKQIQLVTIRYQVWDPKKDAARKAFVQAHQRADGQWIKKAPPGQLPLFNRTRLRESTWAVVVEGEKCCRAAVGIGCGPATTSPGGAGKARICDWTPLRGKRVYLWPDRDEPGLAHMNDVAKILRNLDCELFWIDPNGTGQPENGGDVADLIAEIGDSRKAYDAVDLILANAQPLAERDELAERLEECRSGKYRTIAWKWPALTAATKALRPGTVTILCGNAGATKSYLLIESFLHWIEQGIPTSLFELEEDKAYWLMRALAIVSGRGEAADEEWHAQNPTESRELYDSQRQALAKPSRRLFTSPDNQCKYPDLLSWIEGRAKAGDRIISVDPITAVAVGNDQFIEDLAFMIKAKALAQLHGFSLILVTHPKKGSKAKPTMALDDLAGGSAFPRFAQVVLWIYSHHPSKACHVQSSAGPMSIMCNRTIHIAKARDGYGTGSNIAFTFNGQTRQFAERGVIVSKGKLAAEGEGAATSDDGDDVAA